MNKSVILVISILILCFSSCALNKTVVLSPQEPFEQYENGIRFSIGEIQNWWIPFQTPHVTSEYRTLIPFVFFIDSNENLKNVYLKSMHLCIKELEIELNKENVMIPIDNVKNKLGNPEYDFIGHIRADLFRTEDIQNIYSKNLPLNQLYNEFKQVNEVQFCTEIIYEIDGEINVSIIIWKYNARRKTSNALLDTMMSV